MMFQDLPIVTEETRDKRLLELAIFGPGFDSRVLPSMCTGLQRSVLNSSKSQVRGRRGGGLGRRSSADTGLEFRPAHCFPD
jgi:hypothetical protein